MAEESPLLKELTEHARRAAKLHHPGDGQLAWELSGAPPGDAEFAEKLQQEDEEDLNKKRKIDFGSPTLAASSCALYYPEGEQLALEISGEPPGDADFAEKLQQEEDDLNKKRKRNLRSSTPAASSSSSAPPSPDVAAPEGRVRLRHAANHIYHLPHDLIELFDCLCKRHPQLVEASMDNEAKVQKLVMGACRLANYDRSAVQAAVARQKKLHEASKKQRTD